MTDTTPNDAVEPDALDHAVSIVDRATGSNLDAGDLLALVFRELDSRGMKHAELAKLSGFTKGYISQLSAGNRTPTLGTSLSLANALGMLDLRAEMPARVGFGAGIIELPR